MNSKSATLADAGHTLDVAARVFRTVFVRAAVWCAPFACLFAALCYLVEIGVLPYTFPFNLLTWWLFRDAYWLVFIGEDWRSLSFPFNVISGALRISSTSIIRYVLLPSLTLALIDVWQRDEDVALRFLIKRVVRIVPVVAISYVAFAASGLVLSGGIAIFALAWLFGQGGGLGVVAMLELLIVSITLLCMWPFFWLGSRWALAAPVALAEGADTQTALHRSWQLTKTMPRPYFYGVFEGALALSVAAYAAPTIISGFNLFFDYSFSGPWNSILAFLAQTWWLTWAVGATLGAPLLACFLLQIYRDCSALTAPPPRATIQPAAA